jgi:hypothetical protein
MARFLRIFELKTLQAGGVLSEAGKIEGKRSIRKDPEICLAERFYEITVNLQLLWGQ